MGNCLKSKNQVVDKKNEIIISIVGLDDSGKTTTAKILKGDKDFKEVSPTVGYEPHEFKHNSRDLTLYDLGGGSRVRDIWKHYLSESYGFIYVIDSSNRNRINECRNVFASFVENDKVAGKPILILANKQDLADSLDESEIVQYLNVEELVNRFQIPCRIETCTALKGTGSRLDESLKIGFEWLIKHITFHYDELRTRIEFDVERQKFDESRIRKEKTDRIKKNNPDYKSFYDDDDDSMDKKKSPWEALNELNKNSKDSKLKPIDSKLSPYDRQLLDDMRVTSPKQKLTTISESDMERSRLKNKFLKANNKLAPYDDRSDSEIFNKSKSSTSWAITESYAGLKSRNLNRI